MSGDALRISVGVEWITLCNGLWHSVFLADDSSRYPGGPCSCDVSSPGIIRDITALLEDGGKDSRADPGPTSSESRGGKAH